MRLPAAAFALALALGLGTAAGAKDAAPPGEPRLMPVVGSIETTLARTEDTLLDVAFENRLGFEAVARLNAEVDPWIPTPGTVLLLPTRFVLPDVEAKGLVINVPEMRLYDFTVEPLEVFAAAIGDMADRSLIGEFRIGAKRKDPAWYVPKSIQAEKPDLPAVVPAGPDNPLGSRWMTIGKTSYGIHGTNVRWSIGRMATHGCIRLYEDEVQRLYDRTPTGTPIRLVYQPFKWGVLGRDLYLEAHPDLYELHPDRVYEALRTPRALGLLPALDVERVLDAIDRVRGVPERVGRLPEDTPPPTSRTTSRPTS
ncbi:MAG: L,D-transpeptidase family protein [Myxococcota bacterium]